MDRELADELIAMAEDQFSAQVPLAELMERNAAFADWARQAQPTLLVAAWTGGAAPTVLTDLWRMHDRHDRRLQEIIVARGWPGRSLAGEDGADAAWVIAQHADRHHEWRREWVPLVKVAVGAGEADPRHLARLLDRVALIDEGVQRYGTWVHQRDGGIVFDPPADAPVTTVDERRLDLGLPSLDEELRAPPGSAPYRYMRTTPAYEWPPRT